jgi:phage tail sheath gpL-like
MVLPFKNTPSNTRVPFTYFEVDPSRANTARINQRTLIIGQVTSEGNAVVNVPVRSQSVIEAKTVGGRGSMLALMTEWYRKRDPLGEVWYLPLADNGGAVAAGGSVKFTHVATAAGVFSLYVAGVLVAMNVASTQTLAQLATALIAAINANTDLPVTALINGSDTTQVDITAKNGGTAGNDIDLRVNYLGVSGGEALPTALTVTITALSAGATNPVLTTALTNCVDKPFDFIVVGVSDTTTLDALKSFLDDVSGRWAPNRKIFGHVFGAKAGTVGTRTTFSTGRNNQHECFVGANNSPTPAWEWAANVAGAAAASLRLDPALPLQTLALDVLRPPLANRDLWTDRDTLLKSGMATTTVDDSGAVHIERLITTYQTNAASQPDTSYLDTETMFTLMAVMRRTDAVLTGQFSRCKIAADGTQLQAGSNVVTPAVIKAAIIGEYRKMEADGLVQQTDVFAAGLIVEIDSANPNRVNVLLDAIILEGLRQLAALLQFSFS